MELNNQEFERKFTYFANQSCDKFIDKVGDRVTQVAKNLVPVATGKLRESIHKEKIERGVKVGSELNYAGYVELGTRKMAPRSYLRRAARLILQGCRK
jgi:HK97 gp10 family phage protein